MPKRLEIFNRGETTDEVRTLPIFWYEPTTTREIELDLWWHRGEEVGSALSGLRMGARAFGITDEEGTEAIQNGWTSVSVNGKSYGTLGLNTRYTIGDLGLNSLVPMNIRFTSSLNPRTYGRIALELFFDVAPATRFYGVERYGEGAYGARSSLAPFANPLQVVTLFAYILDSETIESLTLLGFEMPSVSRDEKVTLAAEKVSARGR